MSETQSFSPMQQLKRALYAMRNGALADSLRRAGCPYRLIFGVNLPQLTEIATRFGPSESLAMELWRDNALRESALLAPMLFPADKLTPALARERIAVLQWSEDADILCFKLLRHTSFARQLAAELVQSPLQLRRYTGLRLYFNILASCPHEALEAARGELSRHDALSALASMLETEALFLCGE